MEEKKHKKNLTGVPTFFLAVKFIFSTTYRALYPLASIIALRYDNITTENVAQVLASMQFVNMFGSIFSPQAQEYVGMVKLISILLFVEGCLALMLAFSTAFHTLAISIILMGFSKGCLFPTIVAFTNTLFDKEVQGVTIGYIEIAWGLSSLIGMPFVGITMNIDFRLPFLILSGICIFLCIFGFWFLTKNTTDDDDNNNSNNNNNNTNNNSNENPIIIGVGTSSSSSNKSDVKKNAIIIVENSNKKKSTTWKKFFEIVYCIYKTPLAFTITTATIALMMTMYIMFLSFGIWLVETHNYNAAQVGVATLTVGAADLLAEFSLIKLLKHYEHVKFLVVAHIFLICSYLFLAFAFQAALPIGVGLCAIFFCFYFFEMIIVGQMGLVGSVTLNSKQTIDRNNTKDKLKNADESADEDEYGEGILPAANFVCSAFGCVLGSLLGPYIWSLGSSAPGIVGFITTSFNFSLWFFYYKYHHHYPVESGTMNIDDKKSSV